MPPQAPSASPRFSGGTGRAEERQRQRHHDRAAEPLHRAGDVEQLDASARARPRSSRAVKTASPIANMRRRPKRSPSAAPVRRRTANVSV